MTTRLFGARPTCRRRASCPAERLHGAGAGRGALRRRDHAGDGGADRPADPDDPIARQFVPDAAELDDARRRERADPIGDEAHSPVEGIVHRYPDRVLLKLVHVCAVYCRFCFRREMVGPDRRGALSPRRSSRRRSPTSRRTRKSGR